MTDHPRSAFGAPPQGGAASGPAEPAPRLPLAASAMTGQQVLVLGLGESGLAMARWCARQGAALRVWDSRETPPQLQALRAAVPATELLGAELGESQLDGVTRVLKSPGLAPHDPRVAPLLAAARARGIAVMGELELFIEALAALKADAGYAPRLLAITGTNGKTTTTALTALLVERAGKRVAMAGNIGPTLLDTLAGSLDAAAATEPVALPEVWVMELSSFQLDGVEHFEPDAATVLNITQDHLDWHGSLDAYAAAKARIFGRRALMVINRDDPRVRALVPQPPAAEAARKPKAPKFEPRLVCEFGLGTPQRPGDFGLVEHHGITWLVRALPPEEGIKLRKGELPEIHLQQLMPADALRIRGRHNAANALAALALAAAIGLPLAPMLHALRDYRGEPHRVEPVAVIGGVEAFDDSKGTNVGATVAALEGLGAEKAPGRLVVILGGDGKGQDFTPLAAPVARFARAVALIGRDAAAIQAVLADAGVPMQHHGDLPAATAWCFEQARPGDAVLLSPACASLDMFRNYPHRAEVFIDAVRELAAQRGEVVV
jgi:UDP-N-acetylmuramoylalanine--D-glutamate ligase